jgi:hypothetical protein
MKYTYALYAVALAALAGLFWYWHKSGGDLSALYVSNAGDSLQTPPDYYGKPVTSAEVGASGAQVPTLVSLWEPTTV